MTRAMGITIIIVFVVVTCHEDSWCLDTAQESALMVAIVKQDWPEVEKTCTDWRMKQPDSPVVTWLLSWAYAERGMMKQAGKLEGEWARSDAKHKMEAVAFAESIVGGHSDSAVAWAFLSNAQAWLAWKLSDSVQAQMREEALKNTDRALSLSERCALAWRNKGFVLRGIASREEVINCYNKAIEIAPDYIAAWYYKGEELLVGRYAEAVKCYDKIIQLNPDDAAAWYKKGFALERMERNEEATICYDKIIELDPKDTEAWHAKGFALIMMGRYEEALKCYNRLIEINPNDTMAWSNKCWALEGMDRYEEVTKCYDKLLEMNPNDAKVWYSKGSALEMKGMDLEMNERPEEALKCYEEAIECYGRSIEINPSNAKVWYAKGSTLKKMKRYEEEIRLYDKLLEQNPKDGQAWAAKGLALCGLNQYDEARECFNKAVELGFSNAKGMLILLEREGH